jgi:hypothetical protein
MNLKSAKELVAAANADVETLSADDALKLMDDSNVIFVDVRETDERRKTGDLKRSVSAPAACSNSMPIPTARCMLRR